MPPATWGKQNVLHNTIGFLVVVLPCVVQTIEAAGIHDERGKRPAPVPIGHEILVGIGGGDKLTGLPIFERERIEAASRRVNLCSLYGRGIVRNEKRTWRNLKVFRRLAYL